MKIHHTEISPLMIWYLLIKLTNFALLSLTILDQFDTFPVGWVGQIKIKDQLSPAKAEIRAELGKISFSEVYYAQQQNHTLLNANVLAE